MTAYEQRSYPGAAADTLLTADITAGATAFTVTPGTGVGYPDGSQGPFTVIIDYDNSKAEKIRCSGRVNDTFTVAGTGGGRGYDSTTAQAHTAPAKVRAVWPATDAQEANRAAAQTIGQVTTKGDILSGSGANTLARTAAGADGSLLQFDSTQPGGVKATAVIAGAPVGTTDMQTLTNKTLAAPAVTGLVTGANYASGTFTPQFSTAGTWTTTGAQGNYRIVNGVLYGWFKAVYSSGGFTSGQPLDVYLTSIAPAAIALGSAQSAHALDGTIVGFGTFQATGGPFGIMTSAGSGSAQFYAVGANGGVWQPSGFGVGAVISGYFSFPIA